MCIHRTSTNKEWNKDQQNGKFYIFFNINKYRDSNKEKLFWIFWEKHSEIVSKYFLQVFSDVSQYDVKKYEFNSNFSVNDKWKKKCNRDFFVKINTVAVFFFFSNPLFYECLSLNYASKKIFETIE